MSDRIRLSYPRSRGSHDRTQEADVKALIPAVASMAALSVGHVPATLLAQKRPPIIDMPRHGAGDSESC
jgi:hypothetical protein